MEMVKYVIMAAKMTVRTMLMYAAVCETVANILIITPAMSSPMSKAIRKTQVGTTQPNFAAKASFER